jgi:hypothetical protein
MASRPHSHGRPSGKVCIAVRDGCATNRTHRARLLGRAVRGPSSAASGTVFTSGSPAKPRLRICSNEQRVGAHRFALLVDSGNQRSQQSYIDGTQVRPRSNACAAAISKPEAFWSQYKKEPPLFAKALGQCGHSLPHAGEVLIGFSAQIIGMPGSIFI